MPAAAPLFTSNARTWPFITMWPWPLTFWPHFLSTPSSCHGLQYICITFGIDSSSRFPFTVRIHRHTHTHTHSHRYNCNTLPITALRPRSKVTWYGHLWCHENRFLSQANGWIVTKPTPSLTSPSLSPFPFLPHPNPQTAVSCAVSSAIAHIVKQFVKLFLIQ